MQVVLHPGVVDPFIGGLEARPNTPSSLLLIMSRNKSVGIEHETIHLQAQAQSFLAQLNR